MRARAVQLLALALVVLTGEAAGQESGDVPPDRLPPDASLSTAPVTLAIQPLSLPDGFGVGSTGVAPLSGAPTIVATPPEAGPPERVPPGASFATAAVSFSSADVSFGTTSITAGAAMADLPGIAVQAEGGGYRFTLGADVLFDFDKHDLRPEAGPVLRKLVEQVEAEMPRARWQVEGHTDAKGSDAYNDRLSNRRAASVRRWLASEGGVPNTDIVTIGFGERRPVAPNTHPDGSDDPEGRQKNRRVEILVTPRS